MQNGMKHFTCLALALAGVAASAHEWRGDGPDYSFGTSETPLASGDLTAPASVSVRTLSIAPAEGATVAVTGGPIAFTESAGVSNAAAGTVCLGAPFSAPNGLWLAGPVLEERALKNVYPAKGVYKTVLANASLADWEVVAAEANGTGISGALTPCRVCRTAEKYDVQLQLETENYIKGLKLRFIQQGADIACAAVYARVAYRKDGAAIGDNLDFDYHTEMDVATSAEKANYGVQDLTLARRPSGGGKFVQASSGAVANGLVIERSAQVRVMTNAVFGTSGVLPASVTLLGRLAVEAAPGVTTELAGALSGARGEMEIVSPYALDRSQTVGEVTTSQAQVIPGITVGEITGFSDAVMKGNANAVLPCYFKYPGDGSLTVQFQQQRSSYLCSALVRFASVAEGVRAIATHYYFKSGTDLLGKVDLEEDHAGEGTYELQSFSVQSRSVTATVDLNLTNAQIGGSLTVSSNVLIRVSQAGALPTGGVVRVENGGELSLAANSVGKGLSCEVGTGGVARVCANGALDSKTEFRLDGGLLDFQTGGGEGAYADDARNYLNRLTAESGARITGYKTRIGNAESVWHFGGAAPSFWENGALFVGGGSYTFTVEVDETTGDADPDLVQTGSLRDFVQPDATSSSHYGHLRKRGAGTWRIAASCAKFFGDLLVDAGAVLLARNDVFPDLGTYAAAAVTLNGGALASAASVTNGFANLKVTADSSLAVGADALLSFGDSSGCDWTTGAKLTVEDYRPKAIRFGTSAAALTRAQKRAIRIGKCRGALDEEGYLVPVESGCLVLIR